MLHRFTLSLSAHVEVEHSHPEASSGGPPARTQHHAADPEPPQAGPSLASSKGAKS